MFNDIVVTHDAKFKTLVRWKGKQQLEDIAIPEEIGIVSSFGSSDIFTVIGDNGFAIYDR